MIAKALGEAAYFLITVTSYMAGRCPCPARFGAFTDLKLVLTLAWVLVGSRERRGHHLPR